MTRTRVVIVGGGFAGVATARALERAGRERMDVTLVSRENFTLFTPMLPEVAGGRIAAGDIMRPLRAAFANRRCSRFHLGDVVGADIARHTVTVRHPVSHEESSLAYDELVLATGATASTMGIGGVAEHAVPFKTIADAERVRRRAIGALERAATSADLLERDRLLRFAIVGGNFTGVELAGELRAFLGSVARFYPSLDAGAIEVVLIESGERLLSRLPEKFGKYAASVLSRRGVALRLKQKVASVDADGLTLANGERVQSATVVWAAGEKPSPLAEALGFKTDEHGAIETGPDMAVSGAAHVWALGDCAAVPRPHGGTYAPLAQNAIREGARLGRNIAARAAGRPTRAFRYRELGQMASLGDRTGIAELPGGHMLTGVAAWLLWRAYYLGRVPGWTDKTRVALDWTIGLVFPPRTSRLSMAGEKADAFGG